MSFRTFASFTFAIVVIGTLSGCSGGGTPSGSAIPTSASVNARLIPTNLRTIREMQERGGSRVAQHGKSRMSPQAKSDELLYASSIYGTGVDVYAIPAWSPVGVLLGFVQPETMCVDAAQDVYVTDIAASVVFEYAHGAVNAKRQLKDRQGSPMACAVDPGTGDLAVSNEDGSGSATTGNVIVFAKAAGTPKKYAVPGIKYEFFVAYDAKGDLFVDGEGPSEQSVLAELQTGKTAFKTVTLNQSLSMEGLAWDGKYLAIDDENTNVIHQFKVSGSIGVEQSTTTLENVGLLFQFMPLGGSTKHPQATSIVGADVDGGVDEWVYPAGGTPIKTVTSGLTNPIGAVVSL